ncbi:hypothetical protein CLV33_11411 [Jejuia pallidilutea]|uniref:UspA domain-containing protein n=1 Tax=Jejuia pallidilutea TaxID=504487 RepID=A0A362WWU2_9FLAO|nr:universal stress protein [Jejuia pallidilutea]PQV45244.1 hypothetical protein CLV33_11411 [Jejuia pallidilutea]
MKKNKNKVLVLLDLNAPTDEIISYTAKLAEEINADYEFFAVKKPTEIVNTDSQLSAMRSINRDYIDVTNKIKAIVAPLSNHVKVNVKTSFAIGNVKTEIENKLNKTKPNIVVIGKRKQKNFNFMGDHITNVLYKKNDIAVLVASKNNTSNILKDLPLRLVSQKRKELVL